MIHAQPALRGKAALEILLVLKSQPSRAVMPMLGTEKVARQEDGNDGGKSRVGKDVLETIGAALAVD